MRRKLSLFVLLIYAISFTELHQVLRLPLLVEHYQEHSTITDLSFWDFLVMHYKTDVAHDDTDMRLPFKDCGHSVGAPSLAMVSCSFSFSGLSSLTSNEFHSFYFSHIPPLQATDIFQPPRA